MSSFSKSQQEEMLLDQEDQADQSMIFETNCVMTYRVRHTILLYSSISINSYLTGGTPNKILIPSFGSSLRRSYLLIRMVVRYV
jgi:hypothetical protein